MTRAIIVGSGGQDGRILFDRLRREGGRVWGVERAAVSDPSGAALPAINIDEFAQAAALVAAVKPDRIYYLAAHHHSAQDRAVEGSLELFQRSVATHVTGLVNFLEAIKEHAPAARLFYAASSHVFGEGSDQPQNEQTLFAPRCVYGITKVTGVHTCRFYRDTHGLFASVGILYNHESPGRAEGFLSQRIVRGAAAIRDGRQQKLVLGDLSARVDWGYAPDYVDAMVRILALDRPDEFVIATGQAHSVQEFVRIAFETLGLDWRSGGSSVVEDPSLLIKRRTKLVGDTSKLRAATGWRPTVTFEEMVVLLVRAFREQPNAR